MSDLIVLAHGATDSVSEGFLPAAKSLGLSVCLLTDCAEAHRAHFAKPRLPAYPDDIISCDVFNPLAVIDQIGLLARPPSAIFSNSDHLQTSTSVAADYFGLPGKDWHTTYRAKNKAEMRARLQAFSVDTLWHATVCDCAMLKALPCLDFPVVVKPREGVGSLRVGLARNEKELLSRCEAIWADQPGQPMLIEEYVEGPLCTLETLGDGRSMIVLGSFQVQLSPPPDFVELGASWIPGVTGGDAARVAEMVQAFGVGFGVCHTEFVVTDNGPRIIEINYRAIGDHRDFLLQDTLEIPLFETVLRLYLGEPLPALQPAKHVAQIRYFVADQEGTLSRGPAAFAEHTDGKRLNYRPLRAPGDTIALTRSNKDYLGVLQGTAADSRALALAMDAASRHLSWDVVK